MAQPHACSGTLSCGTWTPPKLSGLRQSTRRLEEVKELLSLERKDHKKEKEDLNQRIMDLEEELKLKNKGCEEYKAFEIQIQRLSKQNSDFEKILFFEKEKLEKERIEFEEKNAKLTEKISKLQKELDLERGEVEKKKKVEFQGSNFKDDFSEERKILRQEIDKLTMNVAGLSTEIMIEKRIHCDTRKELDLMTKERNELSDKVKKFNKSESSSGSPIRPSNLFYDHSVDKSSKSYSDLPTFKKINMQWRIKGTYSKPELPKSSIPNKNTKPKANSFSKPDSFYSANHFIRLAQKNICCSYCGTDDFVHKDYSSFWYGTYHVSSYRVPLNKQGPKTHWVPKST